jgi:radical SAM protein with 4Fe4S-binding SPASM domain
MDRVIKGLKLLSEDISKIVFREIDFYRLTPTVSTLFLTYRCNSHCKTCTFWKRSQEEERKKEIGISEWEIIIDRLAGAGIRVTEIFGGNVLLRKELLISVLKYLKEKDFTIHLPTNQIGLDDDIAAAMACYADFIYISTDGIGEYQDIIRGQQGASKRAESSIAKLLRSRQTSKTPRLICNTTVSKYNVAILDQLADYALTMGFDEIHFEYAGECSNEDVDNSVIDNLKPAPYYIKQDETVLLDKLSAKPLKKSLKHIKNKYLSKGINVVTKNIDALSVYNLTNGTIPHRKCYVLKNEVTIDPSGNLVACPFFNHHIIGNLLERSFSDLWYSKRYQDFRKSQRKQNVAVCNHCILSVQRNPSFLPLLRRTFSHRLQNVKVKYGFS